MIMGDDGPPPPRVIKIKIMRLPLNNKRYGYKKILRIEEECRDSEIEVPQTILDLKEKLEVKFKKKKRKDTTVIDLDLKKLTEGIRLKQKGGYTSVTPDTLRIEISRHYEWG